MAATQSTIIPEAATRPKRSNGRRPSKLSAAQQAFVLKQLQDITTNVTELATILGVHRSTLYRIRARGEQ